MALAQPTVYTIKEWQALLGPPGRNITIYRSGSKAAIDFVHEGSGTTRSVKDLETHTQYDWDISNPGNGCSAGKWSDDWGDPFAMNKELPAGKVVGHESINGIPARVMEAAMPDGSTAKVWLEEKSGLILKAQVSDKSGQTTALLEVKSASFAKPPDSVFQVPPSCAADNGPKVDPDFAVATTPPASAESCVVWVRVVNSKLETITSGFHMGIDLAINQQHPADHKVGMGPDGRPVFGGGNIRDMTGQFKDGVLRLGRIGPMFDIETAWDNNAGFASGMMYRQCFGPATTLLMVVKDPTALGKGVDWRWDKKGKYLPTGQ